MNTATATRLGPVPGRPSTMPAGAAGAATAAGGAALASPPRFLQGPLGQLLWTFRREFMWLLIFSMFVNLLLLAPTLYMLQVFDRVMASGNGMTLLALTVTLVILLLVMAFAEWVRSRLLVRAGARFDDVLNRSVFGAAFMAQLRQPQRSPQQPLTDMNTLRQFLTGNGVFAIVDAPWAVVFIGVLFLMHPWLGWLSVVFVVLQLTLGFVVQRLSGQGQKLSQELSLDASQYLQAKLRNSETVESMGMQPNLRRQWMALHERQMANHESVQTTQYRVQAAMKFLQYTQQALMLSLGALLAIEGKITPGAMVASNALMGNALRPIGVIVQSWGQSVEARAAWARLTSLLMAQAAEPTQAPAAEVKGQLSLRNLQATAPNRETPILHGLDADFRAGEVVGILGPSGAGKSTLARCLLGIWPGATGEVLLDGHRMRDWPRSALGPHLGYLPQDIELFDGTIADNISRFGDVDPDQVIDAARRAGIHDMILRQPKGYDTSIGDGGASLSGGQRQRLGLARAILGHPAVVVLDEPSANLDDAGEKALASALRDLKSRGTTVFMIVHQPQLLAVADRVLVLEGGRITQMVERPKPAQSVQPVQLAGQAAPAERPATPQAPAAVATAPNTSSPTDQNK